MGLPQFSISGAKKMADATVRPIVDYYSAFLKNVKSFTFLSLFCLFWIAVFVTFLRGKPVARRTTAQRKPRRLLTAAGGAEPVLLSAHFN